MPPDEEVAAAEQDAVSRAVDQAYLRYPESRLSIWTRTLLVIFGLLIVINSGASAYNYERLSNDLSCQAHQRALNTQITTQQNKLTDEFFKEVFSSHTQAESLAAYHTFLDNRAALEKQRVASGALNPNSCT